MKNKFYILVSLFALIFFNAVFVRAQTSEKSKKECAAENNSDSDINRKTTEVGTQIDLSVSAALFIVGERRTAIDFKTDKCLSDGEIKWISASGYLYQYNVGFVVSRSGDTSGELSADGLFSTTSGSPPVHGKLYFAAGEQTAQIVYPLELKVGINKVTFTIDADKKLAESNEKNNSFSATFKVSWFRPGIRSLKKN
ncbi:MAG: hypothetical protein WKF90_12895 [Pyrinomonadaceae bacterium]